MRGLLPILSMHDIFFSFFFFLFFWRRKLLESGGGKIGKGEGVCGWMDDLN